MNPTVHEAQIKLASFILRVKKQATEAKQSLKQDRKDKDKAKDEPARVVNYNGNTAVLKQPHYSNRPNLSENMNSTPGILRAVVTGNFNVYRLDNLRMTGFCFIDLLTQ
jgi:hypothetical protein